MPQVAYGYINDNVAKLTLPDPRKEVIKGVCWGNFDEIGTPSFWAVQVWLTSGNTKVESYKLGESLLEEVAACLLGGHGIPAEVGLAAYDSLKRKGFFSGNNVTLNELLDALKEPLQVKGKLIHYRFWRQKAEYLFTAINLLNEATPPQESGKALRSWLVENIKGFGPKTASWVARNWLDSDDVAILDIHIVRAGILAGFYTSADNVAKSYLRMEEIFLEFAKGLHVRASLLDNLMWQNMREVGFSIIDNQKQAGQLKPKKRRESLRQPSLFL